MPPDHHAPLSAGEAAARLSELLRPLRPLDGNAPLRSVLAVSGGPDSLAMLALVGQARRALEEAGFVFSVATVDHGLRPEAAAEADHVAAIARDFGLEHATLRWRGWTGIGNLQAAAREARYSLLVDEALARGARAVVTAHTLDDQIETHLLAKSRGASGPALAGMRQSRDLAPDVHLLRPFLRVGKKALESVLKARRLSAAADPSNDDLRFARVRVRREAAALSRSERRELLVAIASAERMRREADERFLRAVRWAPRGIGHHADRGCLFHCHDQVRNLRPEIAARLLARAVTAAGGALYPPPALAATRLESRLRRAQEGFAATLNGCQIRLVGRDLVFSREYGRDGPAPVPVEGSRLVFDRRFDVAALCDSRARGAVRLVPLGFVGKGNEWERTLPVLFDERDGIVSAHPAVADKAGVPGCGLSVRSRIEWRFFADLRDLSGRPAASEAAILEPAGEAAPSRRSVGPDRAC